jgi:high-affinity iron transporter
LPQVRLVGAAALLLGAIVLAVAVPLPRAEVPSSAPVQGGGLVEVGTHRGAETLLVARGTSVHEQIVLEHPVAGPGGTTSWTSQAATGADLPDSLTLTQLLRYTDHRVPVGLDINRSPGPYAARWTDRTKVSVTTYDGGLVSASGTGDLVLTLSGGGLTSERVLTVSDPAGIASWHVPATYTAGVEARIASAASTRDDRTLWKYWFPGFLVLASVWLGVAGVRGRRAQRTASASPGGDGAPDTTPAGAGRPGRKQHVSTSR